MFWLEMATVSNISKILDFPWFFFFFDLDHSSGSWLASQHRPSGQLAGHGGALQPAPANLGVSLHCFFYGAHCFFYFS